jgi:hypothetical protein
LRPQWQRGRAGKQLALEIGPEAIAKHRGSRFIGQPRALPHLFLGQELRLVQQHAIDPPLGMLAKHEFEDIGLFVEAVGIAGEADPAADGTEAGPVVERGGPQRDLHPALAIIEGRLEQGRALSRIHAGIVEIELGHRR